MLSLPDDIARYWICGGEVLAHGGALPLATPGRRPSAGCRPVPWRELEALAGWHRREAHVGGEAGRYHRLHLRDAERLLSARSVSIC